ncbi:hypothetical protein ACS0TY_024191 [Phlomoides rotata]
MISVQMDMSLQQSNSFGTAYGVPKKGSGDTRRIWSHREEKILIAALKDLVAKGKDCATGEAAEEVPEAIGEMGGSNPSPTVNNTQESNDDNGFNVKGTKKIRSSCDQLESELTNMFGEFCKSSGERLETIARRIGYDHDLGVARK